MDKIIQRKSYLNKLEESMDSPDIKVITGMRRSGKSVLLSQFKEVICNKIKDANILFLDYTKLENEYLQDYHKLNDWIEAHYKEDALNYLLIDEVQMCVGFEKVINSIHSSNRFDIYLTGSNAFLLSSDLSTLFTGRCIEIMVFPFSFAEYRQYYGYEVQIDKAFEEYVKRGGLPGSYVYGSDSLRRENLKETYTTIIQRDLIDKFRLTNAVAMNSIAEYLLDNIGNITSPNSICNGLVSRKVETSHITAGNYLDYLCRAFIFNECKRYDLKGKKYLETLSKFYLFDHGIRFVILGSRSMDYGRIYENIVYIELLRRGYEVYVGKLYDKEVDFVAMKGSEKFYVQVSDDISNKTTLERELAPLGKIKDHYPKFLIANTHHEEYDINGVKVLNIVRWLAGDENGASLAARIRSRVVKELGNDFVSQSDADGLGNAVFDCKSNGGKFIIKGLGTQFETQWSRSGVDSVYGYKDGVELLGVNPTKYFLPDNVDEFESFDFTKRSVIFKKGMIAVFMNASGRFLGVEILDVDDGELKLRYRIY